MKKIVTVVVFALCCFALQAQAQSESQLEQDLAELRAWMHAKSSQADSVLQQEWPTIKKEYREKTYALDQNTKKLSDKSRAEYQDMKEQYQAWEERNETRKAVDLDGRELERWERDMAGTTTIGAIKPVHLRAAFVQALEYTREMRRTWSLRDWDYAEFVFGELNTRRSALQDRLNNSDKIKIAALQVEFTTLQKSREAKDAYQNMRDK